MKKKKQTTKRMKNTRNFSEIRLNTTFHAFKRKTFSWKKENEREKKKTRTYTAHEKEIKKKKPHEEDGKTSDDARQRGRNPRIVRYGGETRDVTQKIIFIKHFFFAFSG